MGIGNELMKRNYLDGIKGQLIYFSKSPSVIGLLFLSGFSSSGVTELVSGYHFSDIVADPLFRQAKISALCSQAIDSEPIREYLKHFAYCA